MKQTHDSFELMVAGAEHHYLAARAANDIGSCIALNKIPTGELEALEALVHTELRERDRQEKVSSRMQMFDDLMTDLKGEVF